jgi:hypothetical protein
MYFTPDHLNRLNAEKEVRASKAEFKVTYLPGYINDADFEESDKNSLVSWEVTKSKE